MKSGGWWYELLALGQVNPADYDATEVHPCCEWAEDNGTDTYVETCDPAEADFWSAYVHLKEGGVECVGDFDTEADARAYANRIQAEQGWTPCASH